MTITEKEIKINNIPAIILGNPSRNVYLYIHGQGGNKEEAYNIAEFVCGHGYQISQLGRYDQRLFTAVTTVDHIEYLFQCKVRVPLNSEIINNQKTVAV